MKKQLADAWFVVPPSGGSLHLPFDPITNFRLKAELRTFARALWFPRSNHARITGRYGEETAGVLSDCFSVAQAFTPGIVSGDGLQAPLTGLEKALELPIFEPDKSSSKMKSTAVNPGVNAWANAKKPAVVSTEGRP